eukprot:230581-Amphidinium_carterae.1
METTKALELSCPQTQHPSNGEEATGKPYVAQVELALARVVGMWGLLLYLPPDAQSKAKQCHSFPDNSSRQYCAQR